MNMRRLRPLVAEEEEPEPIDDEHRRHGPHRITRRRVRPPGDGDGAAVLGGLKGKPAPLRSAGRAARDP
jgi:hypothetical protein